MIYLILKPLIRLTLLVFFRKFDTVGEENLPEKGSVIYVSNHPSALMDPLIVGVTVKPRLYFLNFINIYNRTFTNPDKT